VSEERRTERLLALVALGVLAFNYPLLYLFGEGALVLGVPLLYLYLFAVWLAFIVLTALLMERAPPGSAQRRRDARRGAPDA